MVGRAVNLCNDGPLHIVELFKVVYCKLSTSCHVSRPAVELCHRVQVGETDGVVILREVGLVDARYGEPAHAHASIVDEIGEEP